MAELGLETDTTVVINRTLTLSGKNESRVNGRICSAAVLRSITATLVDIFGQSQHLNLLKVDNHIKVLDDYRQDGELKNSMKICMMIDEAIIKFRSRQLLLVNHQGKN